VLEYFLSSTVPQGTRRPAANGGLGLRRVAWWTWRGRHRDDGDAAPSMASWRLASTRRARLWAMTPGASRPHRGEDIVQPRRARSCPRNEGDQRARGRGRSGVDLVQAVIDSGWRRSRSVGDDARRRTGLQLCYAATGDRQARREGRGGSASSRPVDWRAAAQLTMRTFHTGGVGRATSRPVCRASRSFRGARTEGAH